jgi:hypothetical protein
MNRIQLVKAKMAEMNVPMSAYKEIRHLLNTHEDLSAKSYNMTTERFMLVLESELSFFSEDA